MEQDTAPLRSSSLDKDARTEDTLQYSYGPGLDSGALDERYPNRPHNHSVTLPFSALFHNLLNPLAEIKAQPASRGPPRAKQGHGRGSSRISPHEQRRGVIMRFMSRWRSEVGDDFYPVLRLILPDKDRDRSVYGLKENTIGKLLVKLMKIDKNSEDGYNLLHWKLPVCAAASSLAGDFAGRCYEVLAKRPLRTEVSDLRIGQVNVLLDKLADCSGEIEQLSIFEVFYQHMNPEELAWLIRIILKQMRIGASERTILNLWHPDGEALFNVSSSLRRVCWELCDLQVRLEQDEAGVALMQCFQPQLAQFQMPASFQKMVEKLGSTEDDREFWIEEKLDGERMQVHMMEDHTLPGGRRFCFWSRKAKDYTDLYGHGFGDKKAALTQHLRLAFTEGVRNLILDGEMITWDPKLDKMVAFGTLKTAALGAQNNPHDLMAPRPLFRVFDILYLNDQLLTRYTLRDRHRALEKAVIGVPRRLEVHSHLATTDPGTVQPMLRQIVADSSEGLVLKNPRSMYRLNSRNDDWIKVKPEYMTEFGESLDCVVIGGFFGSGRRGGMLSSFLCGLRVSQNQIDSGANPEKCLSFFKVGGGFKAEDYAEIRHLTEGKWIEWDSSNPPRDYIELAGDEAGQAEKPDVWIRPRDSVVLSVKASSVSPSDTFAVRETLRFPRFRRLRLDRAWDTALDTDQFRLLRAHADEVTKERKEMEIENRRQRRPSKKSRLDLVVAGQSRQQGQDAEATKASKPAAASTSNTFSGMEFCVLSEAARPLKKSKAQIEALIKDHGGRLCQQPNAASGMIIVADKKVVKVASLIRAGDVVIVKPQWLFDCLSQSGGGFLLPFETSHLFHATKAAEMKAKRQTDAFGDSFARDIGVDELRGILDGMHVSSNDADALLKKDVFLDQLEEHGHDLGQLKGLTFRCCSVYFATTGAAPAINLLQLKNYVLFGGGRVANSLEDAALTHIIVLCRDGNDVDEDGGADGGELAAEIRRLMSSRTRQPRIVSTAWVEASWKEGTRLDEERFVHG
ncbi:DNA replication and repair protein [Grosmannia clavigera kw1407]|uniref:DNA ligase n=1 Tax=Grosmannia clavigera (strain kw1407 / UAMH 11150) TaxID=655863 RepID=F0XHJ5_GROCL|nr:DNA replication and repair protein [Grosmannia clavigera kw1407]EFX03113.1 DNA replication and repair protein [Grosmannia clavigera kw1407]